MFDFVFDEPSENRVVGRHESGKLLVSTASVNDSSEPFETAIEHPEYNDGKLVIVEHYATQPDALAGHLRWVETMTAPTLPDVLTDVGDCDLALTLDVWAITPDNAINTRLVPVHLTVAEVYQLQAAAKRLNTKK